MAKKTQWSQSFDCSTDTMLDIVTSAEFHEARSALLEHPASQVKRYQRTGDRVTFEVHCTEYAKGLKGLDKSKTEQTVTNYDFDLKSMRGQWEYHGPQGKRTRVWGDMSVSVEGERARLTQRFNVSIQIPLVGGQIEKLVMKSVDKFWPKYEQLVADFVQQAK